MIRAKFKLQEVKEFANSSSKHLRFTAVCLADNEVEENRRYHKYTPSGELTISIDNPPAFGQFKLGDFYYLDFTPAPEKV